MLLELRWATLVLVTALPVAFAQAPPLPPPPPPPPQPSPTPAAPGTSFADEEPGTPAPASAPAPAPAPEPEPGAASDPPAAPPPADPYALHDQPYASGGTAVAPANNPYRGPSLYPGNQHPAPAAQESAAGPWPRDSGHCPPGENCGASVLRDREQAGVWLSADRQLRAVRATPFLQMLGGAFHLRERVSSPAAFGGEFGLFAFDRLRAGARVLVPVASLHDEISAPAVETEPSVWLWGASLGVAATRQEGFAMSPSLQFQRVQGGDFGNSLGLQVPFEWLTRGGFRVGFDFSLLYGFGGSYRASNCTDRSLCDEAPVEKDRPNSAGFAVNLLLGHVFWLPGESG